MENLDSFVINYDPLERRVHFAIEKKNSVIFNVDDSELLKGYENSKALFTLNDHYDRVFDYIKGNFDGQSEVILRVEVPFLGFNKMKVEFDKFEENVRAFNEENNIKVHLKIDKIDSTPEQSDILSEPKSVAVVVSEDKTENAAPVVVKSMKRVAVVGKVASGKTELIAGLTKHNHSHFDMYALPHGTTKYVDVDNNIAWYEIAGIEFGKESVAKAREQLDMLIKGEKISIMLYCLNAMTGKIEDIERDFIVDVKQKYSGTVVYAVITNSIDEGASRLFSETVSRTTKQTVVFTVLAMEKRTKAGFLQPYGLDDMTKNIYGVRL